MLTYLFCHYPTSLGHYRLVYVIARLVYVIARLVYVIARLIYVIARLVYVIARLDRAIQGLLSISFWIIRSSLPAGLIGGPDDDIPCLCL